MFTKRQSWSALTVVTLLVCGSAAASDFAPDAKPLAPPAVDSEIVVQSFTDDAPLYNPTGGSSSGSTSGSSSVSGSQAHSNSTTGANSSAASTVQQPMSANEMVRRHLGTPEPVPSSPKPVHAVSISPPKSSPAAGGSMNVSIQAGVSASQPTVTRGTAAGPSVAAAADPVAEPTEDIAPRDTRPLAQRLKALRQPAMSEGKSDSWDESAAGPSAAPAVLAPSSRRQQAVADDDAVTHPLAISDANSAPNLAPVSPEAEASPARSDSFATPAPSPSSHSSPLRSSRRTVVNPEDLAVPEPTAAASDNVLFKRQSPLLSVETTGPRTVVIGKEALYTVTLSNGGDVAAQDLVVGVKIPDWTDVVGSQSSAGTTRPSLADGTEPFQWRIPRLEAHGKETLTLRLVPRKGRPFDLAVQWTFSPTASQTMVDVQEPKLTMNIAGPDEVLYGQSKLYRLTLSNPGTGKAENVAIDLWPVGNSTAAPSRHPLGSLKAGESKVIELELTARQGGTVTIHAAASAEPGLKVEATQDVLVRRASIAVSVDGAKSRYAGTMAGYSIKVSNPGNAPAENVHVFAALPPEARFASATQGGQWKPEQGKVVWTLPTLRPGEELMLELRCTLSAPGVNKLQVMSTAAGDLNDMADIITNVEALADLKLDVTDPAGPIAVGDEMVYELRVRNRGTKSAESVGVVAYFSEGIEPISAEGGTHDIANGVVAFRPLATLAVGGEVVYRIHARADKHGKQVFRAEVECGELSTKLVSAEETMIYPNDGGSDLQSGNQAIARRNPDPATQSPGTSDQPQLPAGTRR
ncbi:MAG TPA: CARDB domain-containing protein [Pirellulales bacterium]|jgi:uncharacterized repeat protein (TIGR01451 family)|nr:CARDB domain-containing protein [Pirellulales bacterium]